jgi:hypothetical protein
MTHSLNHPKIAVYHTVKLTSLHAIVYLHATRKSLQPYSFTLANAPLLSCLVRTVIAINILNNRLWNRALHRILVALSLELAAMIIGTTRI